MIFASIILGFGIVFKSLDKIENNILSLDQKFEDRFPSRKEGQ